jgi:L-arabinonolactonase
VAAGFGLPRRDVAPGSQETEPGNGGQPSGLADAVAEQQRVEHGIDTSPGGAADGSTVDAEGYLWNAQVYDGKLIRYAPDGKVDRVIEMPVKKVTSVMFGGPKLDVLYVTSMARPPLPRFPGDGQLRGSLFAIRGLGIHGVPEPRFAG